MSDMQDGRHNLKTSKQLVSGNVSSTTENSPTSPAMAKMTSGSNAKDTSASVSSTPGKVFMLRPRSARMVEEKPAEIETFANVTLPSWAEKESADFQAELKDCACSEIKRRITLYFLAGYDSEEIEEDLTGHHKPAMDIVFGLEQPDQWKLARWFQDLRETRDQDYIMFTENQNFNAMAMRQLADKERELRYSRDYRDTWLGPTEKRLTNRWGRAWMAEFEKQRKCREVEIRLEQEQENRANKAPLEAQRSARVQVRQVLSRILWRGKQHDYKLKQIDTRAQEVEKCISAITQKDKFGRDVGKEATGDYDKNSIDNLEAFEKSVGCYKGLTSTMVPVRVYMRNQSNPTSS